MSDALAGGDVSAVGGLPLAVFDALPTPAAWLDLSLSFVRVNAAYAAAHARTADAFPGVPYFALHPDAEQEALFRRVLETAQGHCIACEPPGPAGAAGRGLNGWDRMLNPIATAGGAVIGLLLLLQDAGARLNALAALAHSRHTLQSIIDALPVRVFWKDRDSRFLGCNTAFARDAGASMPQDLVGRDDSQFPWREQAQIYIADDRQVMQSLRPKLAYDEPQTTPEGRRIWLRTSKRPLFDAAGVVTGVIGFYDDVTQHKEALRQLQLTQTAVDRSKSAFYWISRDGQVLHANDYACAAVGYARDELLGRAWWDLDPDMSAQTWQAFWEELARTGVISIEGRHRRKDGTLFPVEVTANHLIYEGEEQGAFAFVRDIADRKQALRYGQFIYAAINTSRACFYWLTPQGQVAYANDAACRSLGYARDELVGLHIWDFDPAFPPQAQPAAWEALKAQGTLTVESIHRRKDGSTFPIELTANYVTFEGEEHNFVFLQDISDRKRTEQETRIAATAFEIQESMVVTDANATILRANEAFVELTGYSAAELVGKNMSMLRSNRHDAGFYQDLWRTLQRQGAWQGELWARCRDGHVVPQWLTIKAVRTQEGNVSHYVGHLVDITERKAAEERIHDLAFYDPLTRLPNRRLLTDRMRHALASSARTGAYGAVLFIDLDHFKSLNDTKGHDVGDLLLRKVAQRLNSGVRGADTVSRLGGDEFVVMLEGLSRDHEKAASAAIAVAKKILAVVNQPCRLRGIKYETSCSIGISLFSGRDSMENLLAHADTAMYEAKKAGRNTSRLYDPAMQDALEARMRLESWLRLALPQDELQLHYQLQTDGELKATGVEALVRWVHPQRGLISPSEFIPLAEETGLIVPIGQWVLDTAAAQLKAWEDHPVAAALTVSVNVSARQFRQADFVEQVIASLRRRDVDPRKLKLELTESLVLQDVEDAVRKMEQLRSHGIGFSMDDFGTGHSSLSYLKRLPLDQLKIDQSFVRNITSDASDAVIVQTIISMGRTLGLHVIAEGVESEEQLALLRGYGCQAFQGYLLSRPAAAAEVERQLDDRAGARASANAVSARAGIC